MSGILGNIKRENENFSEEVTTQNRMLDSLQVDMDDSHAKMTAVDNRLKHIVANTSTCKLWLFIICELILLIFIILI